ncbi:TniB family NTP-binding protein [Hydrogenophaga sp. ANAO-22]|uniref:TniB family NTP-binding protein n=1 Tax=Hydrogenophaga sp. ANAO-22 TaxID=3166645 RepID=UPI0036D36EF2
MNLDDFKGRRSPSALRTGQAVLSLVIEYPAFRQALESCIDLIYTMQKLRMPSGILIQAEPGMGKTLLLQTIKSHMLRAAGLAKETSYLEVSLDSAVDTHKMAAAMMLALGYPMLPSRPNLDNMNQMIDKGLERKRPHALLLDELQHVCEGNRDITARAVTDWIKVRMDRYNLPIIGAGTRALERLNSINPQFTSRASATHVLAPFGLDDAWRQLLVSFSENVSEVDLGILRGPLAKSLHQATRGNLRSLKRLLVYACMYAADREIPVVSVDDLSKAFEDASGSGPDRRNPFRSV